MSIEPVRNAIRTAADNLDAAASLEWDKRTEGKSGIQKRWIVGVSAFAVGLLLGAFFGALLF